MSLRAIWHDYRMPHSFSRMFSVACTVLLDNNICKLPIQPIFGLTASDLPGRLDSFLIVSLTK